MKQFFGMSRRGNLDEALQGLYQPQFIMLLSNSGQFEAHVAELEKRFPGVPSIGCIGMSYQTSIVENGVGIIAFSDGVTAAANVLEEVSTAPVKYIQRLEQDLQTVGASSRDTVCIDFCAGNDACVLTTINTSLGRRGIPSMVKAGFILVLSVCVYAITPLGELEMPETILGMVFPFLLEMFMGYEFGLVFNIFFYIPVMAC